jgi:D-tyrosyl-tRNA(Tyr) deacylase
MRAVIQRVSAASVEVAGRQVAAIGRGLAVLLGVAIGDTERDADHLAEKIANLRVFEDAEGKLNLSLADAGGAVLVVSNFTVLADCRKGRRPSFDAAARPEQAQPLYERFVAGLRAAGLAVETGVFQEHMIVHIANDGPVTLILESAPSPQG